ncbi:run domain Beclin-1-interacting and cysteine-rich domain-containing protein-like [Amphiura filiformis]|uniref:run domain Beclin-1-interacting and cysteine-rich domain-containing protein-like n=1 Tax=Amphiura filiformis TaxID=82378 RepID=UPI003B2195F4
MSNRYGGRTGEMRRQKNQLNSQCVKDHQELLWGLKFTVEGLLAVQTANVWSTYGGLARLCGQLDKILRHRLRERQALFAVDNDYWLFIQGLRRIHPVLAPSLDRLNRQAAQRGTGRGHLWLKTSLEEHTLSNQLKLLVDDRDHLRKCYYSDAFLCSVSHFSALYMCLQAVEQNNASLLADIDPMLLQIPKDFTTTSTTTTTDDATFLENKPRNTPHQQNIIPARKHQSVEDLVIQPPPFASPPADSILETSGEHAVPHTPPPSGGEVQRHAARNILQTVLDTADGKNTYGGSENNLSSVVGNDPLLNMQFLSGADFSAPVASVKSSKTSTPSGSPAMERVNVKVCECNRSALFNGDMDEDDEGETISNHTKDAASENTCKKCGRLKSKNQKLSSNENLNSPNADKEKEDDTAKARYKQRTLAQSKHYSSAANLLEKSSQVAVKRKTLHKRSQSDAQLSKQGAVSPATECYFPQPTVGQSLTSFLSSQDFHNCPELDKENAHFCISEAIIAAVEQIKVKQVSKSPSDHESDDDEIQELKQRIRLRRSEKKRAKIFSAAFNEPTKMDTTTSSSAYSSSQDSPDSSDEFGSSDEVEEFDLSDPAGGTNLLAQQSTGLTASLASLYSDADIQKANNSLENSTNSTLLSTAETVALSLLKKFSSKQLPAASDLEWMVSEQDAPQALLPLPKSLPISPDDGENSDLYTLPDKKTRIRGNLEWAPPRAQIIFNIHPPPKRKVLIVKQNYRCAGCGMKIEHGFMKRLRYCEYLGKYFCHCCHNNASAYIPGRVLRKWDFNRYPISNFALELLNKMHEDPLFNVSDINSSLYRRIKQLNICKEYRFQLFYLKDFLKTCRLSQNLLMTFQSYAQHLLNDPHVYSMADLLHVKSGELETVLAQLVEDAVAHITQCQLCQAKGFICELCNNDQDIIFPFQLMKTYQCPGDHRCHKCERIKARKHLREQTSPKVDRPVPTDQISPLVR